MKKRMHIKLKVNQQVSHKDAFMHRWETVWTMIVQTDTDCNLIFYQKRNHQI